MMRILLLSLVVTSATVAMPARAEAGACVEQAPSEAPRTERKDGVRRFLPSRDGSLLKSVVFLGVAGGLLVVLLPALAAMYPILLVNDVTGRSGKVRGTDTCDFEREARRMGRMRMHRVIAFVSLGAGLVAGAALAAVLPIALASVVTASVLGAQHGPGTFGLPLQSGPSPTQGPTTTAR